MSAAFYDNDFLGDAPKVHQTGVGDASGRLISNWDTTPPVEGVPADHWTARFTGEIVLPVAGEYKIRVLADDAVRMWLDDQLVIDDWIGTLPKWREAT